MTLKTLSCAEFEKCQGSLKYDCLFMDFHEEQYFKTKIV